MHSLFIFRFLKTSHIVLFIAAISVMLNVYFFVAPRLVVELPSFDLEAEELAAEEVSKPVENITVTVVKGDTLSKIMSSLGVGSQSSLKIDAAIREVDKGFNVAIGDKIILAPTNDTDEKPVSASPTKILFVKDQKNIEVVLDEASGGYKASVIEIPMVVQTKLVSGSINGSLFAAAKNTGADTSVIMSFINLYGYLVDFQRDIKAGDQFKIYYEYKTDKSGRKIKDAKILYASLTVHGQEKEVYRHELLSGNVDYFDAKGDSIRRSLLKTPINGARISSRYGPRSHPVLGYSRMHKGLDYSAPTGTPILAAGDGVVASVKSLSRGYGKHILIKHNGTYSTMYAHLSKFGNNIKNGSKVSQGQVIGYVGSTGLATGPHLHYEVRVNGKQVNPSKISFPKIPPLKGKELARFKQSISMYESVVAQLTEHKKLAKAN